MQVNSNYGTGTLFYQRYGDLGEVTARKMETRLNEERLSMNYDEKTNKITVLDSSSIGKMKITEVFSKNRYVGWFPVVLDETDEMGNCQVQLQAHRYWSAL